MTAYEIFVTLCQTRLMDSKLGGITRRNSKRTHRKYMGVGDIAGD
ncbi:hypothetical protein [Litorimonas sp. WD9-15]